MDKNELCKKVSAGMLLVTMSLYATPVFAYSKDETVYSKLNSEGNSYKTIVSTHLKNTDSENTLNDMTNLTNIKNTNGDEKFSQNGNSLIWDAQKHPVTAGICFRKGKHPDRFLYAAHGYKSRV